MAMEDYDESPPYSFLCISKATERSDIFMAL